MGERKSLGLTQCPIYKEKGDFTITSDFGYRIDPILHTTSYHSGVDGIRNTSDIATIVAIEDGIVIDMVDSIRGYDIVYSTGNYVRIRHGAGRETLYLHMEYNTIPSDIKVGAQVKKGQVIGRMGSTGKSTGAHIHFQVYDIDGKTIINPVPFLIGRGINQIGDDLMYVKITPCKAGDRGAQVRNLQEKLCQISAEMEAEIKQHSLDSFGNLDGVFGEGMKATILKLQKQLSLPQSGQCDTAFCDFLNQSILDLALRIKEASNILNN